MFLVNLFFVLWNLMLKLLDWWNGTEINERHGILKISYRYRWRKYTLLVPYCNTLPLQVGYVKDKPVSIDIQPGLKVLVPPQALGFDRIQGLYFDD